MKAKDASGRRPVRVTKHILRLYIAGQDGKSRRAFKNLKEICDRDFPDEYKIEIVDVLKNLGAAREKIPPRSLTGPVPHIGLTSP